MPSPIETLSRLDKEAATTPISSFYGGEVVLEDELDRLEGYVSLTRPYHDHDKDREMLWNAVKQLASGGIPWKIVYVGLSWSDTTGNAAAHPGWELWRSRSGYKTKASVLAALAGADIDDDEEANEDVAEPMEAA